MSTILIIDTGVANLRSLEVAFERSGFLTDRSRDPQAIADADRVVLPGVGSFAAGLTALGDGLGEAVCQRIADDRPTLSVCLGMQMLAEASDEDPDTAGLGVLPGRATRLDAGRVPHMGWSSVDVPDSPFWPKSGYAAFAHSYALANGCAAALKAAGWETATCPAAGGFVAAARRGAVLACQFHPELSGAWGRNLLERWLTGREARS
jgi:imidazole glycerol-phosphate synthase subunit HisH